MEKKSTVRKTAPKKPVKRGGKRLPGFFSDYGGSGIVIDSMPGKKKPKK